MMKRKTVSLCVGAAGLIASGIALFYNHKRNKSMVIVHKKVMPINKPLGIPGDEEELSVSNVIQKQEIVQPVPTSKKPRKKRKEVTEDEVKKIIELTASHTNKEIAEMMSFSESTVNKYLARARKTGKCAPAKRTKKAIITEPVICNNNSLKVESNESEKL